MIDYTILAKFDYTILAESLLITAGFVIAAFCLGYLLVSALWPNVVYPMAVGIANAAEWCGDRIDGAWDALKYRLVGRRAAELAYAMAYDAGQRAERAEFAYRKAVEWNGLLRDSVEGHRAQVAEWRGIAKAQQRELAEKVAVIETMKRVQDDMLGEIGTLRLTLAKADKRVVDLQTDNAELRGMVRLGDEDLATRRHQLRVEVERYERLERLTNEALNDRDRQIAALRAVQAQAPAVDFDILLDSLGMNDAPKR